jgi:hypothetical protein
MSGADGIRAGLAANGLDSSCRRCGKDEWMVVSGDPIIPSVADDLAMAGGTAAWVRACVFCGCIELYNPGLMARNASNG